VHPARGSEKAFLSTKKLNPSEKSKASYGHIADQLDALRIAIIAEELRLPLDEGAKKTSFHLIQSFINKGAKVFVFTRYENPLLDDAFQLPRNKFLFRYSFGRYLRAQSPDFILYIPSASGTIGAFVRAALLKTQSSSAPLALLSMQYRKLPAWARYFGLRRHADIVFTQSRASMEVFRSFGCKTVLLPGGVDQTVFRPASKQEKRRLRLEHGFQDADRIVLHVGHCNRHRNVAVLAQLVRLGYRVIMIASTTTAIDRALLAELRESGVTVITDFAENIQHFYQLTDCYLFPVFRATSAIDAPLSVLEAMACNLPIVTTRFGVLPDMFQPGKGFYYGDTDEEIIGLVKQAVEEQGCRTSEMVSPYSWDNLASTILETLQEKGHP
jgi:glycosyltransferase involved in cell wall biosynthesis